MNLNPKRRALLFLLLIGIISFLSDFTHEGARSIYGPYLNVLGVSAFAVATVAGLGEFIGQALRIVTGYLADRTKKYWWFMFVGYSLNLLVIPLLMFVQPSFFELAIVLILLERVGKGIRAPAKSALTSFTSQTLGAGKAFAIQEAMDQIGAFLGPLLVFTVLSFQSGTPLQGYQLAFGSLGIFAIATLVVIVIARIQYPRPDHLETATSVQPFHSSATFALYMSAVIFIALGFIDFPILAFHLDTQAIVEVVYIPLIYSLAMGVDAIAAVVFGLLFDKKGILSLIISTVISIAIAPLFFLVPGWTGVILGMLCWGIGMGAQESVLKAVISMMVPKDRRATAYGLFYTFFGGAWFLGSLAMGWLYEMNLIALILFASIMQIIALVLLVVYQRIATPRPQQTERSA